MPKRTYTPTIADYETGKNLRELRKRRGETLKQTVEASGFGRDMSTLAATERGERRLTELEATKLAAHFNTTVEKIRVTAPAEPVSEQAWLGNEPAKPALFAVPDQVTAELAAVQPPLTPDEYREQVWIPYLEQRYAAELKQTG